MTPSYQRAGVVIDAGLTKSGEFVERLLLTYSVEKLSSDVGKVENSAFSAQFEARNLWISRSRGFSPGEKSGQPSFSTE